MNVRFKRAIGLAVVMCCLALLGYGFYCFVAIEPAHPIVSSSSYATYAETTSSRETTKDGEGDAAWRLVHKGAEDWTQLPENDELEDVLRSRLTEKPPAPAVGTANFSSVPLKSFLKTDRRLLASENSLKQSGIIGFDKQSTSNYEYYAYKHIFTNLKEYSSRFVLYPYQFTYKGNVSEAGSEKETETAFTKGAVFDLRPELLPTNKDQYNFFNSLVATTNVTFGKAKALYDVNVGVLMIEDYYDDVLKELTYESASYCELLATYLGKYKDCLTGTTYDAFRKDTKNQGKTALVMLNEADIVKSNLLFAADGAPRFQLLVVPDFYFGAQAAITKKLGTAGVQKLKDYLNKGGTMFASGKAGFLLETWGLLPTGLYDTTDVLTSNDPNTPANLEPCNATTDDFITRVLCLNTQDSDNRTSSYLISAYRPRQDKMGSLQVVQSYNSSGATLRKRTLESLTVELTASERAFLPFSMHGTYGKGRVFVVNGNPLFGRGSYKLFYNHLMLAMSKNVMLDAYVGSKDDKPIPGGEVGVRLDLKLSYINLYDTPVSDAALHIWLPNFISAAIYPSHCVPDTTMVPQMDVTTVNESSHLKCGTALLGAFERLDTVISLEIMDHRATQQKFDVLVAGAVAVYTLTDSGLTQAYDIGGIRTNAALAAYLAGGLNPDPSAYYPIRGQGDYVDNIFGVENKEDTCGTDVDYVAMIPLISPVLDMSDQRQIARTGQFLDSYYNNRTPVYAFPFKNESGKNVDYVDYKWLNGKGVVMTADWDMPAKAGKVVRNSSFPPVENASPILDVQNCNWTTIIDSVATVVKQIYFIDSDRFFEHATQRLLVFVDTAIAGGAATFYPSGIPEDIKNPNQPTAAKKELLWVRVDVYFYKGSEYVQPANINYTHVLSLDRYPLPTNACVESFGDARSQKMVDGYFGNEFPGGLKPSEFSNEMLVYCNRKKVGYDEVRTVSNGSVIPAHYLIPVADEKILRADDLQHFVTNPDGSGHHETYPEVRLIFGHRLMATTTAGQGGKIVMQLPVGIKFANEDTIDPIEAHLVTYSSGLAFYKTTYDKSTRTIISYYRVGGHASNATLPSAVEIMFEELTTTTNFPIIAQTYEMKFDLSMPESKFEKYLFRFEQTLTFKRDRFFRMPAVEIHCKLNRRNETTIFPYELMDPYSRIGVYIQELEKHRTVYGFAESHHVTKPGVQSVNAGFSMLSNLGTSSIPFASFVSHGPGLLIPNAPSTSRVEWDDIWGRRWVNPLRSLFPDIPPVPAPVMTFSMLTTFELTRAGTATRVLEWNSDEELDVRVHIKLFNPYPKYFTITTCKDNDVAYFMDKETHFERLRIFDVAETTYPFQINGTMAPGDKQHINFGNRAIYGTCFDGPGTILKGGVVSETDRRRISTAHLCAATMDEEKILNCSRELADLPTVTTRPDGDTSPVWMYSPEVAKYYPENYIKPDMWDMTHVYYEDNPMDKAFKYHLDNCLPGVDYGPGGNPSRIKPHNILSFPIWKGFGFETTYDRTRSLKRFPLYKGWWSDNLQNRDNTLYAGQSKSNDISVDKPPLLDASKWINARDLINPMTDQVVKSRLKTIHACLYNQHRVKLEADQAISAYLNNVFQNNVIPIYPDLAEFDTRYSNYDCTGVYQYSPYNISMVDNRVYTNTIRDSLMFAANLRAEAHETVNIVLRMKPLANVKYEGLAKVQDGGSFVYWNPPNGPNSFLTTGSSVNVVEAKRNDLTVDCEVFPKSTTTFNPVLYHLLTIQDPAEILREWKFITYINNYGFGDAGTAVYVGGAQATKAILKAGDYTIIKVTFYNNAGFDWNMLYGAVEAEEIGRAPLSAADLMKRAKRCIQKPSKYNFMQLDVPAAIKDYITLAPSDHNLDVSPMYFDFLSINLATISDAFKSDFFYKMTIKPTLPESLTGKVYEIPITLTKEYFDKLPGFRDPTGSYHDYNLSIPSIKFALPYVSGPYQGKAFYTSAFASNLQIVTTLPEYWNVGEARLISESQLTTLRMAAGDPANYSQLLEESWTSLGAGTVNVTNTTVNGNTVVTLNFTSDFPSFPKPNGSNPDIASFNVLLKANTSQLAYGTVKVLSNPILSYSDFTGKKKSSTIPAPVDKSINVRGPWLKVSYTTKIVISDGKGGYVDSPDQRIFGNDKQFTVRGQFTTKNVGTAVAYRVNFTVVLAEGVTVIKEKLNATLNYTVTPADGDSVLALNGQSTFSPGETSSQVIYLAYTINNSRRRLLATGGSLTFIKVVSANMDLTAAAGAMQVTQSIKTPLVYTLTDTVRDVVALSGSATDPGTKPKIDLTATPTPTTTTAGKAIRYIFYKTMSNINCVSHPTDGAGQCSVFGAQTEIIRALDASNVYQHELIPASFTGTLNSAKLEYKVESYNENKLLLATATWVFQYSKAVEETKPVEKPDPQPVPPKKEEKPVNNTQNNNNNNNNNNKTTNETNGTVIVQADVFASSADALPLWAIILIPLAALIVVAAAAIIIIRRYRNVKVHNTTVTLEGDAIVQQANTHTNPIN
jgi:hypothetical protein